MHGCRVQSSDQILCESYEKAYSFARISLFRKKCLWFQLHCWTTESCRNGNLWKKKAAAARSTMAEKIWLFVIRANRPRKLFMVSASFWTTKSCKTEKCEKSGLSQIHVCRETKAFCNTCKQTERTVYGLSFIFGRENRAETGICEKKPTEGIVKNIAKFRVGKVWTRLNAMQKHAPRCTEKKRYGKSRAIDENQQKINRCSYVSMPHPNFFCVFERPLGCERKHRIYQSFIVKSSLHDNKES